MPNAPVEKRYRKFFTNLLGYIKRRTALANISGTIGNGKDDIIIFDGREMTWDEFDYLFPDKTLKPAVTTLDGRAVER